MIGGVEIKRKIQDGEISREDIEDRMQEYEEAFGKMPDVLALLRYIEGHVGALVKLDDSGEPSIFTKEKIIDGIFTYLSDANVVRDLYEEGGDALIEKMTNLEKPRLRLVRGDEDSHVSVEDRPMPKSVTSAGNMTRAAGLRSAVCDKVIGRKMDHLIYEQAKGGPVASPQECGQWIDLLWLVEATVDADKIYTFAMHQPDGTTKIREVRGRNILEYVKSVPLGKMDIDELPNATELVGNSSKDNNFLVAVRKKMEEFMGA